MKKKAKRKLDKTKDSSVNKFRRTPPRLCVVRYIYELKNKKILGKKATGKMNAVEEVKSQRIR